MLKVKKLKIVKRFLYPSSVYEKVRVRVFIMYSFRKFRFILMFSECTVCIEGIEGFFPMDKLSSNLVSGTLINSIFFNQIRPNQPTPLSLYMRTFLAA